MNWALFSMVVIALVTHPADFTIIDAARGQKPLSALIRQLADKRVVFIGENHERYDNHLDQLKIIRGLQTQAPDRWVIGVEYVQRRFQPFLDEYINRAISEDEFLRRTEYFDRWGYDYRLYRPIFRFARDHHIPVIALNAERELTDEVDKDGLKALPPADRARLPEIGSANAAYRERLRKVFDEHPDTGDFERFVEVQLVWDETMADTAANYLAAHPDKSMIVLAGEGHIAFGSGIPDRIRRRLPGIATAILLPADKPDEDLEGADYLLVSQMQTLPPSGKMGITLDTTGPLRVKTVAPGSAAARAGLQSGDRIDAIDSRPVHSLTDFRLALLEKKPGQRVKLGLQRGTVQLTLQR
ncbi:MAG TPA: ChaN family lipoprotein [Terriglobia bacterium]|jgi:uncharacterized iron-regulated protein